MVKRNASTLARFFSVGFYKPAQLLVLFVIFCLSPPGGALIAQNIPEQAFSAIRWRNIGPHRAGRALAASGIPGNPAVFYFGAVDGGVWKTANAGLTWQPISDGQVSPSIGALAIAPSDENIIYVGTGEADMRSDITYGDGVYKSVDGGRHWEHLGLEDTRHIGKILVDPRNPDIVLVAAVGHAYGSNIQRGVFRSTDGGRSWKKVLYRNAKIGAADLAWDPEHPGTVYASTWQIQRLPWDQYQPLEGNGSGLYKSVDGGKTWHHLTGHGLPKGPLGRIGLDVVRGSGGKKVYAIIRAQKGGSGLYHSINGGATWKLVNDDPRITTRMWYFGRIFVDPQNENTIYIPTKGLMRSTDGGKTFTVIKSSPGGDDYHFLWIDPTDSRRMIVASDQGTSVSLDYGRTWSSWYNQPTGQFYHVITDNQFPYRIYGSQQDNGTVSVTSRSDFGAITFRDWYSIGGSESGYIAPDPRNPNIVYGGGVYGSLHRFDHTTGQFQIISPWPLQEFMRPIPQRKLRFGWTSALVFDPLNPDNLYLGAHVLLRSRDGGLKWEAISPDLTGARPDAKAESGPLTVVNAAARGWGVIYTIAPSRLQNGVIWVGSDDGQVRLTQDGGKTWQNITPKDLAPWSKISLIEDSPFDPATAYLAVDRHRVDDLKPYIYRTEDFGRHWTRIDNGIDSLSYVHVVRADPVRQGLLYAGAETGVFVSFDNGKHWQSLQLNMPTVSVRDLAIHGTDLIAGTHGRAFWVLDDLTPLRQLTAEALNAPAHLYRPAAAIRIRRSVNTDTPLPPEEPHGENPPTGAIIDYSLRTVPTEPVFLDVLDSAGNVIRHFSSNDQPPAPEETYFMKEWLPRFRPLTTNAGHNRFVWNLRYPSPPTRHSGYSMAAIAGKGTVKVPQGPLVLPGKYKVRLTVNGKAYTRPLKVEMDPRVKISAAALRTQLRLALQIWNAIAAQNDLDVQVRELRKELARLKKLPKLAVETKSAVAALEGRMDKLNGFLADGGLATLETVVMSADREPAQQMREAFEVEQNRLKQAQEEWNDMLGKEFTALNQQLTRDGRPPLKLQKRPSVRVKLPENGEQK